MSPSGVGRTMSDSDETAELMAFEDTVTFRRYERLREEGPVAWDEERGLWAVLGFEECEQVLRDEATFAHPNRRDLMSDDDWMTVAELIGGGHALVLLPIEQHNALHQQITQRLARSMTRYRDQYMRPVIQHFVERFTEGGSGEFIEEFCDPVSATVITAVLGLPWHDEELVLMWKRLDETVTQTRNRFGAEQEVIVAQCRQLFTAGAETTGHLMASAGAVMFSQPALWARLKADASAVERFLEEMLRVVGVLQQRPRVAVRDTELGGRSIKTGDQLYVVLPAANRDRQRYACPLALDLDGARRRHIAFGSGQRICAGAAFARTEMREAIGALIARIEAPRFDPDCPAPTWHVDAMGSWRPVHTRFELAEQPVPVVVA
jgi:cytochrome P450